MSIERVWIHDDIAEGHVSRSLERALRRLGRSVHRTGKLTHLNDVPRTAMERSVCLKAATSMWEWEPDLVLAMRPGSLPPDILARTRRRGVRTAAWYSDGAVYFNSQYGEHARSFDLVLHTGGLANQRRYLEDLRIGNGLEFPFFTDGVEHPAVRTGHDPIDGGLADRPARVVFLGNTHDGVRRDRRDFLDDLGRAVLHLGHRRLASQGQDPALRLADDPPEAATAVRGVRAGLSFSQRMHSYRGSDHDSAATRDGGVFPFPSRIAQYLSWGLPVLTRDVDPFYRDLVPELHPVSGARDVLEWLHGTAPDELGAAHQTSLSRSRRTFHALGRAALLLKAAEDDTWRSWDAESRARAFTLDGLALTEDLPDPADDPGADGPTVPPASSPGHGRTVILTGTGWTDPLSDLSIARRALVAAGHRPLDLNPHDHAGRCSPDSTGEFRLRVDVTGLGAEAAVTSGDTVDLTLDPSSPPSAHFLVHSSRPTRQDLRRASHCDRLFAALPGCAAEVGALSGARSVAVATAVDAELRERVAAALEHRPPHDAGRIRVHALRARARDVELSLPWLTELGSCSVLEFDPDERFTSLEHAVSGIADMLEADVVLHVPTFSGSVSRPTRSIGWVGLGPGLHMAPRVTGRDRHPLESEAVIQFEGPEEFAWKLDLYADPVLRGHRRDRAADLARTYSAGDVLSEWLSTIPTLLSPAPPPRTSARNP